MTSLGPAWPERAAWGTAPSLRAWQTAAVEDYAARSPRDFLTVATPGAGKTTFALSVAADLLGRRIVDRITDAAFRVATMRVSTYEERDTILAAQADGEQFRRALAN